MKKKSLKKKSLRRITNDGGKKSKKEYEESIYKDSILETILSWSGKSKSPYSLKEDDIIKFEDYIVIGERVLTPGEYTVTTPIFSGTKEAPHLFIRNKDFKQFKIYINELLIYYDISY